MQWQPRFRAGAVFGGALAGLRRSRTEERPTPNPGNELDELIAYGHAALAARGAAPARIAEPEKASKRRGRRKKG
ncbi:MAG TPA: hypothetical protein VFX21_06260 [Acidimicrobiia bacterium]|nr:hypothetical protein [Acidimicrobiia bacterium]